MPERTKLTNRKFWLSAFIFSFTFGLMLCAYGCKGEGIRNSKFWLSELIFEKCLKKPPAQEVGERIVKEVEEWNSTQESYCYECGSKELVRDVTGSEGLFSFPHHFYRCKECGNAQEDSGLNYRWEPKELEKERIIEDGDGCYRYMFLTLSQKVAVEMIGIVAVSFLLFGLFMVLLSWGLVGKFKLGKTKR